MKSRALSVIIPSRNREASVGELMAALGRQEGLGDVDVEIIVVDDASDPPYRLQAECLRLLRNPRHMGAPASRNLGLAVASGDFVAMMDDDLRPLHALYLSRALEVLDGDPTLAAVFPSKVDRSALGDHRVSRFLTRWVDGFFVVAEERRGPLEFGAMTYVARTHALREVGGYDPAYGGSVGHSYREEADLQARLKARGWRLWLEPSMEVVHLVDTVGGQDKRREGLLYWVVRNHVLYLRKNDPWWPLRSIGHLVYHGLGEALRQGGWAAPVALRGWRDGLRQGLGEIPGEGGRP